MLNRRPAKISVQTPAGNLGPEQLVGIEHGLSLKTVFEKEKRDEVFGLLVVPGSIRSLSSGRGLRGPVGIVPQ
jgi:hypothetical protein